MNATEIASLILASAVAAVIVVEAVFWLRRRRHLRTRSLMHARAFVAACDVIFADTAFPDHIKDILRRSLDVFDQPDAAEHLASIISRPDVMIDEARPWNRGLSPEQQELFHDALLAFAMALSYQHRRGSVIRDHLTGREMKPGLLILLEKLRSTPPGTGSGGLIAAH